MRFAHPETKAFDNFRASRVAMRRREDSALQRSNAARACARV
jgi:hypothetical protein